MGRRIAVWATARGMRKGFTFDEADRALRRAFRRRDDAWRLDVIADARARNAARLARKLHA
jgi:hypothetical protein